MAMKFTENQLEELNDRFGWLSTTSWKSEGVPKHYRDAKFGETIQTEPKVIRQDDGYRYIEEDDVRHVASQVVSKQPPIATVFLVDGSFDDRNKEIATLRKRTWNDGSVSYEVYAGAQNKLVAEPDDFSEALKAVREVFGGKHEKRTVAEVTVGPGGNWVKGDMKSDLKKIADVDVSEVDVHEHTGHKGDVMGQSYKTGKKTFVFMTRDDFEITSDEEDELYERYMGAPDIEDILIHTNMY